VTRRLIRDALTPKQQALVEQALPVAHALARKTARLKGIRSPDELEEVDQTVGEALCKAAPRYNGKRPTGFLNYAWKGMFGAVTELIGSLREVRAEAVDVATEGAEDLEDSTDYFSEVDEDDLRELESGAGDFVFDLYAVDALKDLGLSGPLRAALEALEPDQRQAFLLRYQDDTKIDDIASTMGIDRSKVKRLLAAARKSLRRLLFLSGIREAP
jgi:RNA polymerase sigma factor (sigma-70 family)